MKHSSLDGWSALKRELQHRWRNISELELFHTENEKRSIIELLQRRAGLTWSEASRLFSEMSVRYHVKDQSEEKQTGSETTPTQNLEPAKDNALKDLKPKDDFHSA